MNFLKTIILSGCLISTTLLLPTIETNNSDKIVSTLQEEVKDKNNTKKTISALQEKIKNLEAKSISRSSILRSVTRTSGKATLLFIGLAYANKVLNGTKDISNSDFSLADLQEYGQKIVATAKNSCASLKFCEKVTALGEQIRSSANSLQQAATKKEVETAQPENSSTASALAHNNSDASISPEEQDLNSTSHDLDTPHN